MIHSPNLFDWATSELSQDAFLCWLVAHAGNTDRVDLQRVARAFIAFLWNRSQPDSKCEPADVSLCGAPEKQLAHTDVFFSARINRAVVLFLIEDKVRTSHHGDSLARYSAWIDSQKQALGSEATVKVYFKTGYHFDEDRTAATYGYLIIGLEDVVDFFGKHTAINDILSDYQRYVAAMLDERRRALNGYRQLSRDFVQYEFICALKERCPEHLAAGRISHGINRGGAPWTQYDIATFPRELAGISEVLFLRVDARQDENRQRNYYLGLRQYGRLKHPETAIVSPSSRSTKLARLAEHRQLFKEACAEANTTLRFSKPSGDFHGANESEIGLLFFDTKDQTPEAVLKQWPVVHQALIKRLSPIRV